MNLHQFHIVPAGGHFGPGQFERGHEHRNLVEIDIIDRYVLSLRDELEMERIRHSLAPTRKPPGVSAKERLNTLPHIMPVVCAIGLSKAVKIKPAHNFSTIYFGPDVPKRLYTLLSESVGHWGSLYVHGHKTAAPMACERGLRIEPFMINGPSAIEYAARLDRLGRDIGRAIADFCRQSESGAVFAMNKAPPQKGRVL